MRALAVVSSLLFPTSAALGQSLADAARLVAQGDTGGAIGVYEALIARNERNAEAHYQAGLLYLARVDPEAAVSADRRKAEEHLRYAARFAPDSARYWLALADYFRSQTLMTLRVQVPQVLGNAVEAADRAGNPTDIADASYRSARVEMDRWAQYGHRYTNASAGSPAVVPEVEDEWQSWERLTEQVIRPVSATMGTQYLDAAERKLRHGLEASPSDARLLGLLVVALGERGRWGDAAALLREATALAPDSGRAWAVYGLTLARINRYHEAQDAFRTALARMTPEERAPYLDIGQIMRRAEQIRWEQTPDSARAALDTLYWRSLQPLLLTGTNELQAEFYARLTYADHRWTDPWRGYRGAFTDMGAVYVHYGPPDLWAVLGRDSMEIMSQGWNGTRGVEPLDRVHPAEAAREAVQTVLWIYNGPHYRFTFEQNIGFAQAYFPNTSGSAEAFRAHRTVTPARFDNVPIYRAMDTIAVQAAQFRGPSDSTEIAVFGALPLGRMTASLPGDSVPLVSGAFLQSERGDELLRDRRAETLRLGPETPAVQHRSWRLTTGPGTYALRVEAYLPERDRAARGVVPFAVRSYWGSWLMMSDILVANRVAPRDSTASRWRDYLIEPNGGWVTPGQEVGLLWEIYNLTPDDAGQVAYSVDLRLTVESITRRSVFAQVVGGIADAVGVTAKGDDRVALHYTHTTDATPNYVNVEYLTVDLADSPEGTYTIEVEVRDLRTGGRAVQRRVIHVDRAPPTKCDPCPTQWP